MGEAKSAARREHNSPQMVAMLNRTCERSSHERDNACKAAGAELADYGSDARPYVSGAHLSAAAPAARPEQSSQPTGVILDRVSGAHMSAAEPGGRNIVRLQREQAMLNRE